MKSLLFYSFFLLFYNISNAQESRAKEQSEKWVVENVFPYFDSARFLTDEENALYEIEIENSLTTFVFTGKYWLYNCYQVKRNDTLVFENALCGDELYDYLNKEYREGAFYRDSLESQIYEYLGPPRDMLSFFSPASEEEMPAEEKQKELKLEKVTCLLHNADGVYYSGTENLSNLVGTPGEFYSAFYAYKLFFSFVNSLSKGSSKRVVIPMVIHLDEDMNVLNAHNIWFLKVR